MLAKYKRIKGQVVGRAQLSWYRIISDLYHTILNMYV